MIERENIKKAINMIRQHSDSRQIVLDNLNKTKYKTYLGAVQQTPDKIHIYTNYNFPEEIQEASIVHELLHILLDHEGFPSVKINKNLTRNTKPDVGNVPNYIRDQFASTIAHPQVFMREKNEFDLDIDSYFDVQVNQKIRRFESRADNPADKSDYFSRQQDILIGLDYYFYPLKQKQHIQNMFRDLYPEAYKSCSSLFRKLKFNNPKESYNSALIIKKHIIRFGRKKRLLKTNTIWEGMEIYMP